MNATAHALAADALGAFLACVILAAYALATVAGVWGAIRILSYFASDAPETRAEKAKEPL